MKQVIIDNNSWHYKFNQWTYGTYYKPTTLCPYFWKTLLALVIIPLVLLGKGLVRLFDNYEAPDWDISYHTQQNIWKGIKIGSISLIAIGLIYVGVMGYWEILLLLGVAVLVLGMIFGGLFV